MQMKKYILFIFLLTGAYANSFAQWEYQFFSLRAGVNHNFMSPKPDDHPFKFQHSPMGDMKFAVDQSYVYYGASYYTDLLFHYDMENNKMGFITGVRYTNNSFGVRYNSSYGNYSLTQKFKVSSLTVPVVIKYGKNIYKDMKYFYAGAQFNLNMGLVEEEQASWTEDLYVFTGGKEKLKPYNISYIIGYNYWLFHAELGFMPDNFLDTEYTVVEDGLEYQPFSDQKKNIIYLQTGVNIPISEWLMSKSWTLEKIRRKFHQL